MSVGRRLMRHLLAGRVLEMTCCSCFPARMFHMSRWQRKPRSFPAVCPSSLCHRTVLVGETPPAPSCWRILGSAREHVIVEKENSFLGRVSPTRVQQRRAPHWYRQDRFTCDLVPRTSFQCARSFPPVNANAHQHSKTRGTGWPRCASEGMHMERPGGCDLAFKATDDKRNIREPTKVMCSYQKKAELQNSIA